MGGTKTSSKTEPPPDHDFNELQFEKTLATLKDSQESINSCCQWCLANRQHHKKIVNSWLNVLKRVKVEQRVILFYLANDVVQYSKRRNYEYVESWGTALQKATTMVRDERVKHKILRIFKIWEQRGVYSEEFICDLCGLISVTPTGSKGDEPHEFQSNYVINKIKNCSNLEKDTDSKQKILKEHNPKIQIDEGLITSLKDRAHVDDVEKELEVYVKHMEDYINALKLEIKNRITLISVLKQAETQLEADRKDVKMVAHAYKMFGQRVKTFQKKLEERISVLPSPLPSPDINAPSPSPDSDLELPDDNLPSKNVANDTSTNNLSISNIEYTNPGYYNPINPVPPPTQTANDSNTFLSNGFSSFMGNDIPFDLQNLSSSSLFGGGSLSQSSEGQQSGQNPPLPVEAPAAWNPTSGSHMPLQPPPMPPFSKSESSAYTNNGYVDTITTNSAYGSSFTTTTSVYDSSGSYDPTTAIFDQTENFEPPEGANPYPPSEGADTYTPSEGVNPFAPQDAADPFTPTDQYDPEEEVWEKERTPWRKQVSTDTPESPPTFEREGYVDPVEYHDDVNSGIANDVDHRMLPSMGDLEDSLGSLCGKDVDHRNLISLTGSPLPMENNNHQQAQANNSQEWNNADQDYRQLRAPPPPPPAPAVPPPAATGDRDYRMSFPMDNVSLPPPPPPSSKPPAADDRQLPPVVVDPPLPRKGDNVDSIDMDLSDELEANDLHLSLEPPPPLPDLPDDEDANQFLDEISNDLSEFSNLSSSGGGGEAMPCDISQQPPNMWSQPPPNMPPPMMNFGVNFPPPMPVMPPPPPSGQPPWMQGPFGMPPPRNDMPTPQENDTSYLDDNPYLTDDHDGNGDGESVGGAMMMGGPNGMGGGNFRGRPPRGGFRGGPRGGRGGRGWGGGGFRGGRGRGGGGFRHKGNFRGGFRGGF